MIRKQRKAQWLYECRTCDYTSGIATDLFGAQENQLRHEKNFGHAFQRLAEAYVQAFYPFVDLIESVHATFAPPPNIPHDPALLRDRRKWGGR